MPSTLANGWQKKFFCEYKLEYVVLDKLEFTV